jgi:endonuclease G
MRSVLHLAWAALLAMPAAAQDFKETAVNDPQTCRPLWQQAGLPRYAREADRDTTIVCHQRYVLSHNNDTKTPDWVFEQLSKDQITGRNTRPKPEPFAPEPSVSPDKAAALADYKKSGFDRGHQAPSEDFKKRLEWMKESFFLSNMAPQQGVGFNQHIWKNLEELTRGVVRRRGTLYVITGPVNRDENGKAPTITKDFNKCGNEIRLKSTDNRKEICAAKNKDSSARCEAGVTVPVGMFKIMYDPRGQRVNAYLLPNIDHTEAGESPSPADYLNKFRVTVHAVERATGLEFFRDLPKRTRDILLLNCGQRMFGATDGDEDS